MSWLMVVLLAFALLLQLADCKSLKDMDMVELVEHYGWRVEKHIVQTEDGYLIRLFRLLDPKASAGDCRPPVLMMHGLLGAVEMWVLQGPDKDLAFVLAKAGFDIWMGQLRGETPEKGHISMSSMESEFWRFSWHEMGYYDVPALIDYVLQRTKGQQVLYVGHSMGVTMFLAMGASRPEYNAKVRAAILLASSFHYRPRSQFLHALANFSQILPHVPSPLLNLVLPSLRRAMSTACEDKLLFQSLCLKGGWFVWGREPLLMNSSLIPLLISHLARTSARTMIHYSQLILSGRFQKYDLGPDKNLRVYGSVQPPEYDLSLLTVPTALYYGATDVFVHEQDVLELAKQLPNVTKVYRVPSKVFNHGDYLWGLNAYELLYKDIIGHLHAFTSSGLYSCYNTNV